MQPKKRLPRIERDDVVEIHEDENAHLWAVSYSDFLMALLSFFILFFSVDTPERQKLILNLAQEFTRASGTGSGNGTADGKNNQNTRLPANIMDSLSNLNVTVDKEKESLVINFPDEIYHAGKYQIPDEKKPMVAGFLKVVKPYENQINLYFEGHADDRPLKLHKNHVVTDNFVLSSLRASSALMMARDSGFSEKHMFIEAASSNLRNSRSLSIRIEPRKESL